MTITENYDDGLASVDAHVVVDLSDYDTFVAMFARTYDHSEDPAALVDCYHEFQQLRAKHPNAGSSKLATKLGVSRSNIRRWVDDGAVPYVVQGLQTAETRGWISMEFDSPTFRAINRLVAWVMSSGSINGERWSVQFVVDDDQARDRLEATLALLDLETTEPDNPGTQITGTVLSPTPDGSVLGRVLHCLGTPRGGGKQSETLRLPPYLQQAPNRHRREWLATYLNNRGRDRDTDEAWVTLGEDRPSAFKQAFIDLVNDVTGAAASISGEHDIYVSAAAAQALDLAEKRHRQLDSDGDPLPLVDVKSLAKTYGDPEQGLETLDQYRRFEAADGYYTNVAREEDIPMSRAQKWRDGSVPRIVQTVDLATDQGWLAEQWTEAVAAVANLVIGIHAGGSLGKNYHPQWHLDGEGQDRIRAALETIGVGATVKGATVRPSAHGASLGRALVVAGAPHGAQRDCATLPDWVYLASAERREQWLRTIIAQRGGQFKERSPTRSIKLARPQSYLVDVAVLIETVTSVDVSVHENRLTVSADAVRELGLA